MLNEIFRESFMKMALYAGLFTGTVCSFLGVLVVLRRIVFISLALAQFSSLGLAVAAYFEKEPVVCSLLFTVLGVFVVSPVRKAQRIPRDSIVGLGFAASWALSILFLSKAAHGDAEMMMLMKGNILGTTPADLKVILFVMGPVLLLHILFFKELLYVSFDPDMARTQGMDSAKWNFLFNLTLGVTVAVSMKLAGVLLTFAFLLFPAVASLLLSDRIKVNIAVAVALSLVASFAGLILSYIMDFPTGPMIVMVLAAIFVVARIWSAIRGG